jgi:hypothetical protein
MKVHPHKSKLHQGSTLVITLTICTILALLVISYLGLIRTQYLSVARAQYWNNALAVAEAGVEEGMAHLNSILTTTNLATNTWVSLGSGTVGKTNFLGTSYSAVTIQTPPAVTNPYPVITATAYVPGPIGGPVLTRKVKLTTRPKTVGVGGGIIVKGTVNSGGSKTVIDSFDSSNTNYSTGGLYDPAKATADANITSISSASNAVNIGEMAVYGSVHTVYGVQPIVDTSKQGTGTVGDAAWVNGGNLGIESGHAAQDAAYTFTDVTLPSLTWTTPTQLKGQSALKTNGVTFAYVLDNSSNWQLSDLSSAVYVKSPNVILYVTSTLSLGTGTEIYITPGASLTMYVAAPSASIGGQGVVNSTGLAKNFTYYGLPTNTSLGVQANASMVAQIYAPEADITYGGGGSSPYDFSGQIVGKSFNLNGHYSFHYDESLGSSGSAITGYVATSWIEL